jgi:hypothetical protein
MGRCVVLVLSYLWPERLAIALRARRATGVQGSFLEYYNFPARYWPGSCFFIVLELAWSRSVLVCEHFGQSRRYESSALAQMLEPRWSASGRRRLGLAVPRVHRYGRVLKEGHAMLRSLPWLSRLMHGQLCLRFWMAHAAASDMGRGQRVSLMHPGML